jgi:hypothetical protein
MKNKYTGIDCFNGIAKFLKNPKYSKTLMKNINPKDNINFAEQVDKIIIDFLYENLMEYSSDGSVRSRIINAVSVQEVFVSFSSWCEFKHNEKSRS